MAVFVRIKMRRGGSLSLTSKAIKPEQVVVMLHKLQRRSKNSSPEPRVTFFEPAQGGSLHRKKSQPDAGHGANDSTGGGGDGSDDGKLANK